MLRFVGWWGRSKAERREAEQASLVTSMATAFATALAGVLTAQTTQITQQGAFLGTLQDLSARKAAQVLGSKGGSTTARRKKEAKRAAAAEPQCVLCDNPLHKGTTIAQIEFHRQHEMARLPPPATTEAQEGN